MSITVRIPTVMRNSTESNAAVQCNGDTVAQVISDLTEQYPELTGVLFDADSNLHKYVNIYLADDDIRYIGGLEAPVKDGDEITLLPAVAGGYN
jgi:molybdopterin synthase sulfur carrier subunit